MTTAAPEIGKSIKKSNPQGGRWEEMYQRLLGYHRAHGDCLVPNRYEEDPQLGAWVSTQRRHYKLVEAGEASPMTDHRIKLLAEIGFKWSAKHPRHLQWETRFRSLVRFKERYGHTQVPINWEKDVRLANWISTQRQEYQNLLKGRTTRLDEKRIRLLNGIGFSWQLQRGGRKRHLQEIARPAQASGQFADASSSKSEDTTDAGKEVHLFPEKATGDPLSRISFGSVEASLPVTAVSNQQMTSQNCHNVMAQPANASVAGSGVPRVGKLTIVPPGGPKNCLQGSEEINISATMGFQQIMAKAPGLQCFSFQGNSDRQLAANTCAPTSGVPPTASSQALLLGGLPQNKSFSPVLRESDSSRRMAQRLPSIPSLYAPLNHVTLQFPLTSVAAPAAACLQVGVGGNADSTALAALALAVPATKFAAVSTGLPRHNISGSSTPDSNKRMGLGGGNKSTALLQNIGRTNQQAQLHALMELSRLSQIAPSNADT